MTARRDLPANLPWVSIIVLHYSNYQDTIECLDNLLKLEYARFSMVVVDNHSPNNSLAYIKTWLLEGDFTGYDLKSKVEQLETFQQHVIYGKGKDWDSVPSEKAFLTTIQVGENLGFAGGNNVGIDFALHHFSPDFVWLLNNDTVVAPNSLSELVHQAQAQLGEGSNIGIWGSKLLYYHQPDTIQAIGGKLNLTTFTTSHLAQGLKDTPANEEEYPNQDYVVGASLFVCRKFLEEVGLLSEEYFLYFEELDWAKRGQKAGFSLGYVAASKVYHKEGASIGSNSVGRQKSDLADYHGIRSKIIFFKKFYPEKSLHLYTWLLASVFLRLGRGQFKRAFRVLSLLHRTK
ncbi:glycosyltransferase family 2 protein [Rufibacter sp. XAAS-G3-1]|uniref:glycosyltransferase family 2 protein n=1 Tax=Rufibacter sp. XAAS-G3-1 TaxID=2729134 RepID=UPI0015E66A3C|nr:glycosyltransferase family 2 protein [Rufibacter sp. XAAS-G3-1]